jgi:L-seryl-tRNA(Ser) seleniumtransferase
MIQNQLKKIPSVSQIIFEIDKNILLNNKYITFIIKLKLEEYRQKAKKNNLELERTQIIKNIINEINTLTKHNMKSVINGTGIVLHTGLGRAPIKESIAKDVINRVSGYTNLEFNLKTGKRGQRQDHIDSLLSALTGAQSAMCVNNNAAAVILTLNELAEGREVIVSRGQQVEIGGSFRIPEVIKKSGCKIKEVGTTNRTHLKDYEEAINKNTGVILWVHTSNYVVKGFTSEVSLSDLVKLGKKKRIPVMADLGCGALVDLSDKDVFIDMFVQNVVRSGVGVITFSGDKLLGGPQAGLIVGNKTYLKRFKHNSFARAFRCDKWTIAFLEALLRSFYDDGPSKDNLAIDLMTSSRKSLLIKGKKILSYIPKKIIKQLSMSLVESEVEAGSGSLPEEKLKSIALEFKSDSFSPNILATQLRAGKSPVVGYIKNNTFFIDLKAIIPGQEKTLAGAILEIK